MKIVKIKQKDLERIINEQLVNPIQIGKYVYDTYKKLTSSPEEKKKPQEGPLPFTPENLKAEINKLGIVYPDIVLAQAKWESTHFTSKIFEENNNLFGMKLAYQRDTTAIGKNRGHAKYKNWQDSVKDYKLWQSSNGSDKLPRDKYFDKLSDVYCPPPDCPKGQYGKNIKSMLR
jgi:hypothetical protein